LKLIRKSDKIKVLANGELKGAYSISAHAFSDKAKEAIEKNGGKTFSNLNNNPLFIVSAI
jgi:large subunit ribosomal protein L15